MYMRCVALLVAAIGTITLSTNANATSRLDRERVHRAAPACTVHRAQPVQYRHVKRKVLVSRARREVRYTPAVYGWQASKRLVRRGWTETRVERARHRLKMERVLVSKA